MAKVLKYDSQTKIDEATASAEFTTFNGMSHDFRKATLKRFMAVKDNIEDWQDAITNEELLKARLQTLAAKSVYTEANLMDMSIISNILWNIEEEEAE